MPHNRHSPTQSRQTIANLAKVPRIETLDPIAARLVYSLRLIALHERARRDPVSELTVRLGSVVVAAKTLALAQVITATWPENIHVSRFCCCALTHDEATIGAMVEAVQDRNRDAFSNTVEGLVRPARIDMLWDAASELVMAEMHGA